MMWKSHMAAVHCKHSGGMVQVVMTGDQFTIYERWLASHQRQVFAIPYNKDTDLPTFGVGFIVRGERNEQVQQEDTPGNATGVQGG